MAVLVEYLQYGIQLKALGYLCTSCLLQHLVKWGHAGMSVAKMWDTSLGLKVCGDVAIQLQLHSFLNCMLEA